MEDWYEHKSILKRSFTVMSFAQTQLLCMSLQDFNRLKVEFFETYEDLTLNAHSQLEKTLRLKVLAIQNCIDQYHDYRSKYHQLFEGNEDIEIIGQSV